MVAGDDDFDWLLAEVTGAEGGSGADDVDDVDDVTPPASPIVVHDQWEPILAQPVQAITEAEIQAQREQVELGDPGLDTRGRQQTAPVVDRPPPAPVHQSAKRKSVEAGGEDRHSKKKRNKEKGKEKSRSHHRSFSVEEEWAKRNFETYVADPLSASINVFQYLADVAKEKCKDAEDRAQAAENAQDEEKRLKLEAQKKLKEATDSLTSTQGELATMRTHRDKVITEKDAEALKATNLQNRVDELEAKEKEYLAEIARLKDRINELEASLKKAEEDAANGPDSADRVAELEEQLKESRAETQKEKEKLVRASKAALAMREKGFKQALDQVMVVNPAISSVQAALSLDHEVDNGAIVKVDKRTKSKTVVYRSNPV